MTTTAQLAALRVFVTHELDWRLYQEQKLRLRLRIERAVRELERRGEL
jgi:hypothetical protein